MKDNKEEKFHLVYTTEEDIKNNIKRIISELTEDKKSIFLFNGEYFYEIGRGHNFVYGFYTEYVTKTGILANQYSSGRWSIGSDQYKIQDGEFVMLPKAEITEIDFNNVSFPVIKSFNAKTIASELISVQPKQ